MLYEELTNPTARKVGMLLQRHFHVLYWRDRHLISQQWNLVCRFGDDTRFDEDIVAQIDRLAEKYEAGGAEYVRQETLDSESGRDS